MKALGGPASQVLVVEDDCEMRLVLTDNLEYEGYSVSVVDSGEAAMRSIASRPPSVVILDVMLPGMSGFEVCRQMRAAGVIAPIILLTARAEELDRVTGLDAGADDYVTKPFGVRELLARVRAQLRRANPERHPGVFRLGNVHANLPMRVVTRDGRRLRLSTREFELLRYLYGHRGEVLTREQLLRDVWGYHRQVTSRTVDNFIAKLRAHVEPEPQEPRYIITVHGVGYEFVI